jgi:hypothetical protein
VTQWGSKNQHGQIATATSPLIHEVGNMTRRLETGEDLFGRVLTLPRYFESPFTAN